MPTDVLGHVPPGADLFVDANIFIYAISGVSKQYQTLLSRCAGQDIFGATSWDVISEVTHRLMLSEAYQKALIVKPRGDLLRHHPDIIRNLSDYWTQVSAILRLALVILTSEIGTVQAAQNIRSAHGLMTLDSVIVATVEEYGIVSIATHDRDFDRVGTLTVYHPTDIP